MKLYALSVIIITLLFLTASCQSTRSLNNTNLPVLTEQAHKGPSKDVSPLGVPTGTQIKMKHMFQNGVFPKAHIGQHTTFYLRLLHLKKAASSFL